jgi:hypothetical protein
LFALSATAYAEPHTTELSVDASAGLAVGHSSGITEMDHIVSGAAVLGVGGGYRFTAQTSAGVFLEYGLGDPANMSTGVRVLRAGVYGRHRFNDLSLSARAGYEQLDVDYEPYTSDVWRGIEVLRPELGITVYRTGGCTVDLYAAASLGVFEYYARGGQGDWIGNGISDLPHGPTLHGWLMLGTRVVFDAS